MLRADTPQEQFNLIGAGRRNLIINGAMPPRLNTDPMVKNWRRVSGIIGDMRG
jgi:hypothetical protein